MEYKNYVQNKNKIQDESSLFINNNYKYTWLFKTSNLLYLKVGDFISFNIHSILCVVVCSCVCLCAAAAVSIM